MAEITLKFDARNPIAKKTLDYILSIGVFSSEIKKTTNNFNAITQKAIKEAKSSKTTPINLNDFRKQLH